MKNNVDTKRISISKSKQSKLNGEIQGTRFGLQNLSRTGLMLADSAVIAWGPVDMNNEMIEQ